MGTSSDLAPSAGDNHECVDDGEPDDDASYVESETLDAADLYTLVLLQTYYQRAAQALARCPAPGRLSIFLDDYSVQPLVERAARRKGSREG